MTWYTLNSSHTHGKNHERFNEAWSQIESKRENVNQTNYEKKWWMKTKRSTAWLVLCYEYTIVPLYCSISNWSICTLIEDALWHIYVNVKLCSTSLVYVVHTSYSKAASFYRITLCIRCDNMRNMFHWNIDGGGINSLGMMKVQLNGDEP